MADVLSLDKIQNLSLKHFLSIIMVAHYDSCLFLALLEFT